MSFNRAQFLIEVLGADAAHALAKAASRSEYLAQMIVPRTILAMLEAVPAYTGTVPGLGECSLSYTKSEKGFTGNVALGEDFYKFEQESIFHVAGVLSTAMGLDTLMFTSGRNTELQRLGKSIDLMAKAHLAEEESPEEDLSKTQELPEAPKEFDSKAEIRNKRGKVVMHSYAYKGKNLGYVRVKEPMEKKAMGEGSGQAAGPVAPAAPAAPTATAPPATTKQNLPKAPASAAAKPPKPVGSSTVKLTRSEQSRACPVCSMRQFNADGGFVGCLCFRALAKSVDVTDHGEYAELRMGEDWDRESILTLLEAVGRK